MKHFASGQSRHTKSNILATPRSEGKTNDQMQNGPHDNQGGDQSQNFKQVHFCTGDRLDRGRCHTVYGILRAGNQ